VRAPPPKKFGVTHIGNKGPVVVCHSVQFCPAQHVMGRTDGAMAETMLVGCKGGSLFLDVDRFCCITVIKYFLLVW